MKTELYLKGIRLTREELEHSIARLRGELEELQETCPHTYATKTHHYSEGNPMVGRDPASWDEFQCHDCGKRWTESWK